ncbi:MAG: nucleotidyl transferase AbiEii/AbiGii toxin family protein [Chitinispirillaceae bacterium]|nr:nucleotidyl transferase AbiEii/AbiGii toxin family protein [Chitinispirillaceae bacterium]
MTSRDHLFSIEHIKASAFHASPGLTEQALHCLELVCELSEERLAYQFKGGNSLLLILDTPQRFSIDADIATDCTSAEIEEVLTRIVDRFKVFTRWEKRQPKTKPWIPLASYRCYFRSKVADSPDVNIMLDAQLHASPYRCERRPVACGRLFQSGVSVEVPLPGSIVGDKLLTLGPRTLGIPVGKGKAAQRLKHFFDVSRLLEMRPPLREIRESFASCLMFECRLQGRTFTPDAVVRDTLESCWPVVRYPEPPVTGEDGSVLAEHIRGLAPFAAHLFRAGYSWTDLQYDMARAACCIAAAGSDNVTDEQFARVFIEDDHQPSPFTGTVLPENGRARRYWDQIAAWEETAYIVRWGGMQP